MVAATVVSKLVPALSCSEFVVVSLFLAVVTGLVVTIVVVTDAVATGVVIVWIFVVCSCVVVGEICTFPVVVTAPVV